MKSELYSSSAPAAASSRGYYIHILYIEDTDAIRDVIKNEKKTMTTRTIFYFH